MGAKAVYLSHRKGAGKPAFAGTIPQVANVESLSSDGSVRLEDGSTIDDIDDILLCTGYRFDFPFLDPASGVKVTEDGRVVDGLVSHCLALKMPTLFLIGVPIQVVPFPLFEDQAKFFCSVLKGAVTMDTLRKLHQSESEEFKIMGYQRKYLHKLGDRQWEYRRVQASLSRFPSPSMNVIEMYNDCRAARNRSVRTFRDRQYQVSDGTWRVFCNGEEVTGKFEMTEPFSTVTIIPGSGRN